MSMDGIWGSWRKARRVEGRDDAQQRFHDDLEAANNFKAYLVGIGAEAPRPLLDALATLTATFDPAWPLPQAEVERLAAEQAKAEAATAVTVTPANASTPLAPAHALPRAATR